MDRHSNAPNAARQRAQNHFAASEQRDTLVKQEIERERAATNAKIAKQRAARLAKEAEDKTAVEAMGALFSATPQKTKKSRKIKT